MAIRITRERIGRIFTQRCFYLFALLLALIAVVPFLPATNQGRMVINWINVFLVIATVAAVGRTMLSFVIAALLAVPTEGWVDWLLYLTVAATVISGIDYALNLRRRADPI